MDGLGFALSAGEFVWFKIRLKAIIFYFLANLLNWCSIKIWKLGTTEKEWCDEELREAAQKGFFEQYIKNMKKWLKSHFFVIKNIFL